MILYSVVNDWSWVLFLVGGIDAHLVERPHHVAERAAPVGVEVFATFGVGAFERFPFRLLDGRSEVVEVLEDVGQPLGHRGCYRLGAVLHIVLERLEIRVVGTYQSLHIASDAFVIILVDIRSRKKYVVGLLGLRLAEADVEAGQRAGHLGHKGVFLHLARVFHRNAETCGGGHRLPESCASVLFNHNAIRLLIGSVAGRRRPLPFHKSSQNSRHKKINQRINDAKGRQWADYKMIA